MHAVGEESASRILLARILVIVAVLCALGSIGLWVYSAFYPEVATPAPKVQVRQVKPTPAEGQRANAAAQKYMKAFLAHDYGAMWMMLHPQIQAQWPDQQTFERYWKARFQEYMLQSFTAGAPSALSYWVNPETMTRYDRVIQIPISLQLVAKQTSSAEMSPARPEQLFQNLPFIVQQAPNVNGKEAQWLVLAGGPADLEAPILPPVNPAKKIVQVPILMYHHISRPLTPSRLDVSLAVTPALFGQQLDHLKAQKYTTITFNQLFDALYYGGPLPTKPIILTFDDGYDDAYATAYPMLKQRGYSGMFYIITGKVGWKGQVTWPQLREMLRNGMQMGSHTVNHADMGAVLQASEVQAQKELQVSRREMQRRLGVPIQQFCYPSGEPFRNYSIALQQRVLKLLVNDGYVGATTDPGGQTPSGVAQSSLNPLTLLRLRIDGRAGLQEFMGRLQ